MNTQKAKKITKQQIRKIHTLVSALEIPEDRYREMLHANFYTYTSKNLTAEQADFMIENLERWAIEAGVWERIDYRTRFDEYGERPGMATPKQMRAIELLWKDAMGIRGFMEARKTLRRFLSRHFKVDDIRFLTRKRANDVIYVLRKIKEQNRQSHSEPF
jgi:hypothetical protein